MKTGRVIKCLAIFLLAVGLLVYIVCAMFFLSDPDEGETCQAVELVVNDESQSGLLDKKELEDLLKSAHVYPKGLLMKDVDTKKIEEIIRNNEFVSKVECYKSSNGKLCVSVEQRTPVLIVAPEGQDSYFVDAKGKVIPNRGNAVNLVVASGNIDEKFAKEHLAEFGQFLQTDEFWNNQIEQIYVLKGRKGERVVELIPRVGNHVVYLGTMDDYQKKLRRLRIFYEKAVSTVGWNKYARVNLEY